MRFKISGTLFECTPEEVRGKLRGIAPDAVAVHGVQINGQIYPVKQVITQITGLSKADFGSHQAHSILKRMGLEVITQ